MRHPRQHLAGYRMMPPSPCHRCSPTSARGCPQVLLRGRWLRRLCAGRCCPSLPKVCIVRDGNIPQNALPGALTASNSPRAPRIHSQPLRHPKGCRNSPQRRSRRNYRSYSGDLLSGSLQVSSRSQQSVREPTVRKTLRVSSPAKSSSGVSDIRASARVLAEATAEA